MPNLTVYYPDEEERNSVKDELAAMAAGFGYHTVHAQERGNIRELLGAIVGGEMALVLLSDEQRIAAINELRRLADDSEDVDWIARDAFRDIASALERARNREEQD